MELYRKLIHGRDQKTLSDAEEDAILADMDTLWDLMSPQEQHNLSVLPPDPYPITEEMLERMVEYGKDLPDPVVPEDDSL